MQSRQTDAPQSDGSLAAKWCIQGQLSVLCHVVQKCTFEALLVLFFWCFLKIMTTMFVKGSPKEG